MIIDANIGAKLNQQHLSVKDRVLVRRALISVSVVRQSASKLKRILISTGGMHLSMMVIESGTQLACASGTKTSLLNVVEAIPNMFATLDEIKGTLPELLSTEGPSPYPSSGKV